MEFGHLLARASDIALKYREKGKEVGNKDWRADDYLMGLMKDLGDLSKMLMVKRGLRNDFEGDLDDNIAHELADCMWSIIIIAKMLDVDLEKTFMDTMSELDERITGLGE